MKGRIEHLNREEILPQLDFSDLDICIHTDDFSRYGYIYPTREKSEALDRFKIFKAEVENQYELKIKVVRLDRGVNITGDILQVDKSPVPLLNSSKKME